MILSDKRILEEIESGNIVIEPYDRNCLGTNSYDVHLGKYLATYKDRVLDAKAHNEVEHFEIPKEGIVLEPNTLYLGVTVEYTETYKISTEYTNEILSVRPSKSNLNQTENSLRNIEHILSFNKNSNM